MHSVIPCEEEENYLQWAAKFIATRSELTVYNKLKHLDWDKVSHK